MDNEQKPFAYQAARFSFWAPFIAILINLATKSITAGSRPGKIIIGLIAAGLILAGFFLAIYVLFAIRKLGKKNLIGYGISALLINGLLILSSISVFSALAKSRAYAKAQQEKSVAIENLSSKQVITDSTVLYNEELNYRIEIPPQFKKNLEMATGQFQYAYIKDINNERIAINIEHLPGTFAQKKLTKEEAASIKTYLPPGSQVRVLEEKWQNFTIEIFHQSMPFEGENIVAYVAQIPLTQKAIQINIAGAESLDQELHKTLKQILQSLKGQSSWK